MIEKLVLKINQEDEPVPFEKLERMALKAWYDKTNEIIDAVNSLRDDCNLLMGCIAPEDGCKPTDEDLREMVKDPKYWKEQDPETVRKVELAFQKKYGENTQNTPNNVKNSHLFQGNEQKAAENCESAKNAHKSDLEEALEGFPGLFKSNKDEPLVDAVMQEANENHKIRSTNERLRKALDCAINTLDTVYGMSENYSNIETYIKCKRIEINGIIKGGKDENI